MQEQEQLNPEELQVSQLNTDARDQTTPEEITADDLDVKNYLKVNPSFYIKGVESGDEEQEQELYKVLNPLTDEVETRELTDDEKKEIYVLELKKSKQKFQSVRHNGNKTTNQFDSNYKKKRKNRNKQTKASRKANR